MKTVFTNDMVAHVWANQNQESGKSGNGQFFFEGKRLYSYGRHFLVALAFAPGVYLINSDSYSITTGRHQSLCRRAIRSGATEFYIPALTELVNSCFSYNEFLPDSFVNYYLRVSPKNWAEGLDSFLRHIEPKRAESMIKARIARFATDSKAKAKAELAANVAKAKEFIAKCKTVKPAESIKRDTVSITGLHGNWSTEYDTTRIAGYNTLPDFVTVLNKWLVHCRKYGDSAQVKRYVWPLVKAWRAQLAFKVGRSKKDNRLRFIKALFNALRVESSAVSDLTYYENVNNLPLIDQALDRFKAWPVMASIKTRLWLGKAESEIAARVASEARAKADMEKKAAYFTAWRNGDSVSSYNLPVHPMGCEFAYLRIKGEEVQTSRGASVPLAHALRLYAFMKAIKQPWEGEQRVGHFALTSICDNVATIGCHKLHFDDIEKAYNEYQALAVA